MSTVDIKEPSSAPSAERRRDSERYCNLEDGLTVAQQRELTRRSEAGWQVKFVRNLNPAPAQLVIASPGGSRYAVVEADGSLRPFYNTRACDFS